MIRGWALLTAQKVNLFNTPRQNWLIIRRKVISSFYIFSIDTSTSKSTRKFLKGVISMFMVLKRFFSIRAIQSTSNHDLMTSRKCFLRGIVMQYKNQIFYLETYFSSQKFIISTILRWNDFFQIVWKFFLQELWNWFLLTAVKDPHPKPPRNLFPTQHCNND